MRHTKIKRKVYRKIPYFLFFSGLILIFLFLVFVFSKQLIFKQTFFVSPLAKGIVGNQSKLEESLSKNNIQFSKIENSDNSYIITLKDQGIVYLDSTKNLEPQISSLQLILSRLTIEGKKFKKLDLRFDSPIIEF